MFRRKLCPTNQANDSASLDIKVSELRAALGPLSGRSLKFCTDACLKRYLEARNWKLDKAKKMLEETLKWRSTYKPEEIRWEITCSSRGNSLLKKIQHKAAYNRPLWSGTSPYPQEFSHEVAHEGETGKVSKANFHDRLGGPVLIMRPGKQNTSSPEGNVRHLVYLLENAILNLPEGKGQMSWLIDFSGCSLNTNISIKTARDVIYLLQNHYPERLAIVVLYNPPRIFEAFWKVVKYFLDAKTFAKIKFVYPNNKESTELMKIFFDAENLPREFGGKATLNYDHEEFSRLMAKEDVKTAKFWGIDDLPSHTNGNGRSN